MKTRTVFLSVLILSLACGSQAVVQPPQSEEPVDPYGDPPGYSGDPFSGFGSVITLPVPGETETEAETVEEQPEDHTECPWSIQISAASTEAAAARLAESVLADIDADVFIDIEGIWWKVRVGAFASSEDANELLTQLRAMGFTDAWIVSRQQ